LALTSKLAVALAASERECERLRAALADQDAARRRALHKYVATRDAQIAQLHLTLHDAMEKVRNPLKLMRVSRQPPPGMNPAVAARGIIDEAAERIGAQLEEVARAMELTAADQRQQDAVIFMGRDAGRSVTATSSGAAAAGSNIYAPSTSQLPLTRRNELAAALRRLGDALPLAERRLLLTVMAELRAAMELESTRRGGAAEILAAERAEHDAVVAQLRAQTALLQDQLQQQQQRM
jgi:hypothetical protein